MDAPREVSAQNTLDDVQRAVRLAATVVLALLASGIFAMTVIRRDWLDRKSLFYEQFLTIEPPSMVILGAFALIVLALVRFRKEGEDLSISPPRWLSDTRRTQWLIVIGVLLVTSVGTVVVFHRYLFLDDEYAGWFQAVIYSKGHLTTTVPPALCGWIQSITPTTVGVYQPCILRLRFLPLHSAIRGAFLAAGLDSFTEPVMAALSVLLVILIARRVWPGRPERAVLSALFFAVSTQFLVMSMTGFAMTSHLCFALIWLWLYVHPDRWALVVLPWVGVFAMGLHSPFPHLLFVAPFLLRLLVQRRWAAAAYVGVVYAIGMTYWFGWLDTPPGPQMIPIASPTVAAKYVAAGNQFEGMTAAISMIFFATWSVPVVFLFLLVSFILWSRLDEFSRWLAVSLLATVLARSFLSPIQGGGWGYRFGFAVLGNMAMLAAVGADFIGEAIGRRRLYQLVAAALLVGGVVQLPLRGFQAWRIVRPYSRASEWMAGLPADVVIFDPSRIRYGNQLVRNDPFLRRGPLIMDGYILGDSGIAAVKAAFPGRVRLVEDDELTRFGLRW
jgi:hypothetical protein